ncbi:YdcF family protein [Fibrella sp. HMF5335]|uniref:YdcF family protein n=1 Tax=Fibrella rubiginis TaxID=2817060 RepID=A0A939GGU9_9BACT|nr:YdcF family protein [Fibrella rubiginis]MBO0937543.1 YdcF family protein [Fibrella rubiginis]
MFYFLSKTAGYFLTPAGLLLAALVSALAFKWYRRRLILSALCLYWLLGNSFLVDELARAWEISPTTALPPPNATNRVAVVLTGGMVNASLPVSPARPMLAGQADRLGQVLYLYKTRQVSKILISGGSTSLFFLGSETMHEGQQAMAFLHLAGVPVADLLWETRSRNTRENALFSAMVLRNRFHTDNCILVTSAFHMRRAEACFRKAGLHPLPFPAAFIQQPRSSAGFSDLFVPHEQTLAESLLLIRELFGYLAYTVAGYV